MPRLRGIKKAQAKLRPHRDDTDYLLALVELMAEVANGTPDDAEARKVALSLLSEGNTLADRKDVARAKRMLVKRTLAGDGTFAAKVSEYCTQYRALTEGCSTVLSWAPLVEFDVWLIGLYAERSRGWQPRPIDIAALADRHFLDGVDRGTIAKRCKELGLPIDTGAGRPLK